MLNIFTIILVSFIVVVSTSLVSETIDSQFQNLVNKSSLMGLAVEISKNNQIIYKANFGLREYAKNLPLTNQTVFRMASLSKSMTASGLMLLVAEGKVKLTDSLESVLGFKAINPNFPNIPITIQMILTHQSSLIECSAYNDFLVYSVSVPSGDKIPNISTMFIKGQKFYNECTFSKTHAPGTYYQYVNLNFVLAGTVLEKVSGERFDLFMRDRVFKKFSDTMTFNSHQIKNINDVAVLYVGQNGQWVPQKDNFNGVQPAQFNMTGYINGTNAAFYGPQGSVRASVSDLNKFINILRNRGFYNGTQVIPSQMVQEMSRPRYQFRGIQHGDQNDDHGYGFGLSTSTYRHNDNVWPNEVVVGHTGSAYGLASGMWFSGNYSVSYAMNGALYDYHYDSDHIYSKQRQAIGNITYQGIKSYLTPK